MATSQAVTSGRQCDRCGRDYAMGSGVCKCGRLYEDQQAEQHVAAIERAQAGLCSHGGHGWDGETCGEIPAPQPAHTLHDYGDGLGSGHHVQWCSERCPCKRK